MNTLYFLGFSLILGYLAYRTIIFLLRNAITVFILIGLAIVALLVLADADLLPKNTPQTTISQQ